MDTRHCFLLQLLRSCYVLIGNWVYGWTPPKGPFSTSQSRHSRNDVVSMVTHLLPNVSCCCLAEFSRMHCPLCVVCRNRLYFDFWNKILWCLETSLICLYLVVSGEAIVHVLWSAGDLAVYIVLHFRHCYAFRLTRVCACTL